MNVFRTMKVIAVLLVTLASISAKSQKNNLSIKCEFKGVADGTKFEMIPTATHSDQKAFATATSKDDRVSFIATIDGPRMFYVRIVDTYAGFQLMAEPGKITVSGKLDSVKTESGTSLSLKDVKVSGSKSHNLYVEKIKYKEKLNVEYENYHNQNRDVVDKLNMARSKTDTTLEKQIMETAAYKKFEADENAFFKNVQESTSKLILDNKSTWWGPFLLPDQFSYLTPAEKRFYDAFSPEAKNSYYGKIVQGNLYPVSKVGKPAPSFAFEDVDGKALAFTSVAKDRKFIVVDFWASWCGPCRKQLPALKAFYEEMKEKGVEVVSVSIDKKEADWQKALEEEKMPWPNYLDRASASSDWGVKAIPAMFLLDSNGVIVAENVSLDEIKKKILM